MSKTIKVSDSVWKKLRAMEGSCSSNIESLLEYREIERDIKKYIDDKLSAVEELAKMLLSAGREIKASDQSIEPVETSDQSDTPITPKETKEQETKEIDSEGFGWTSLEERIATIKAQEKKVFKLNTELNILKRPINEYHNWTKTAEEEKDDPVLYEDDLREAQSVLDDQGVKSIEELEEKLADRINEAQSEYDRESEILLKMRRTM